MPRYYFDIDDNGDQFPDRAGEDLPRLDAAETRAREVLVQLAGDEIPRDGPKRNIVISVREEQGPALLRVTLDFHTEKSRPRSGSK